MGRQFVFVFNQLFVLRGLVDLCIGENF